MCHNLGFLTCFKSQNVSNLGHLSVLEVKFSHNFGFEVF